MKLYLLSIIVIYLFVTNTCYAQEKYFEGTIRMAVSMDFDQLTRNTNKLAEANTGNKLADVMKQLGGLNEIFSTINGQFEYFLKVKGNKVAQFNTQDGSMLLVDCDKGEITMTYPFAKLGLKYTVAEFIQLQSTCKYDINTSSDKKHELAGYKCCKAVVVGKMNGKETSNSEFWYTDKIVLPKCYLEVFHRPGFVVVEETKIMGNPVYVLVTEVNKADVSGDNFIIPEYYEIFTQKDYLKFSKKLNKAAENKKTYTVGSKIPDVFWDF